MAIGQAMLSFMLEHVPDATIVVDDRGRVILGNSLAQELFGYEQHELVGQSVESLLPPRFRSAHITHRTTFSANPRMRGMGTELDIYAQRKDGSEFPADVSLNPVQTNDGVVIVAAIRDISRHRQLEEEKRRYVERLERVYELSRAIQLLEPPELTSATALRRMVQLVPCRWGSVVVYSPDASAASILAHYADGEIRAGQGEDVLLEPRVHGDQPGWDLPHIVADVRSDEPVPAAFAFLRPVGLRSYLVVPLGLSSNHAGLLAFGTDRPKAFTAEHATIAREMGNLLAVAIQNAHLYQQVQQARMGLRRLSQRLMEVQEAERRHIARELHDQIGQELTILKISLQTLQRQPTASSSEPSLQECIRRIEGMIQQTRDLARHVRPPVLDNLGLVRALRWYIDREAQRAGLIPHFIAGDDVMQLPAEIETACFRVAQEALTNVVRHAHASRVWVELRRRGDDLVLTIRDDGVGLDVRARQRDAGSALSLGILGMQERVELVGGRFALASTPSVGTEVQVRIPVGV